MNISNALEITSNKLQAIKNPHFEAELLLSMAIDKPREYVLTHPEYEMSADEAAKLNDFVQKRLDNIPVAYLNNSKSFYGLDFYVDENVLVPRPETEMMVDKAIELVMEAKNAAENIMIADIGTGCGCIIASIANILKEKDLLSDKKISLHAVDVSEDALNVAKLNASKNGLARKINFHQGNLLAPLLMPRAAGSFAKEELVIFCANLPYLTREQIESSPSIQKEPKLALDGGQDGMEHYIGLFKQTAELKSCTEAEIIILAEIDHTQKDVFLRDCHAILPDAEIEVMKDMGGYERLVSVKS